MKAGRTYRWIIKTVSKFFVIFIIFSFVITCSTMLFLSLLSESLDIVLTESDVSLAAKLTFVNAIFISLIFTVIDTVRRRLTVDRYVGQITEASEKIIQGRFDVRIEPETVMPYDETFIDIIDCINKIADELSGVETLRTDFVANVSHEMKTPLSVIQNYGRLLQSPDLPEEKRIEYAEAITEASGRLSDMITNILKLNRLENQQIYPRSECFDLGEQLCECLLQFENVWESRGIEIDTEIEDGVTVCADRELLSLVWNNLLSNAFKFTEDGGSVSVSLCTDGRYAVVKVKDTGCGMSPEVGAHIFEKFYQGDTSHATQGNGLGLALVKRIVDIVRGEISVESAVGVGTTFTVRLRREENGLEEAR